MDWNTKLLLAEEIVSLARQLCNENKTIVYLYGKTIVKSLEKIIHLHENYNFSLNKTINELK